VVLLCDTKQNGQGIYMAFRVMLPVLVKLLSVDGFLKVTYLGSDKLHMPRWEITFQFSSSPMKQE